MYKQQTLSDMQNAFNSSATIVSSFVQNLSENKDFTGFPDMAYPLYNSEDTFVVLTINDEIPTLNVHNEKCSIMFFEDSYSYDDPFDEAFKLVALVCDHWEFITSNIQKEITKASGKIRDSILPLENEFNAMQNFIANYEHKY